jgi:ApaG protein
MIPYEATTEAITVTVRPVYLDQPSDFMNARFVFGYLIRIANDGLEEVQLLRRHWYIGEVEGKVREVEGQGVVGEQPIIAPGAFHEYSSYCVLSSFEGWMEGTYLMQRTSGDRFRVAIPRFDLRAGAN